MSNILSDEEKERIRKEQLRKIAELEKKRELESQNNSAFSTQKMLNSELKEKKKNKVKEDFEKKIFEDGMRQRGFVKYKGEWISKEEHLRFLKEEEEREKKLIDKVEKAKERKIDKSEENYNNLVIDNEHKIKTLLKIIYSGIVVALIGLTILLIFGVKLVGIAVILQFAGAIAVFGCMAFLFEIECLLMRAQRLLYDEEIYDFEYNDIKSPVRKLLRYFAKKYDPLINKLFSE